MDASIYFLMACAYIGIGCVTVFKVTEWIGFEELWKEIAIRISCFFLWPVVWLVVILLAAAYGLYDLLIGSAVDDWKHRKRMASREDKA